MLEAPSFNLLESTLVPRVVVIEDDVALQGLIRESMQQVSRSTDLSAFVSAEEAIHSLWQHGLNDEAPVDILFLDVFLQGEGSGLDVLEYVSYLPSDVTVVLMSSDFSATQLAEITKLATPPVLLPLTTGQLQHT